MADQTTAGLIQLVKEKETIPDSGAAYSDSVLLNYLDQSIKGFIVPAIQSVMGEHFVVSIDTEMPSMPPVPPNSPPTNVGNTLMIPSQATGMRLRDIYMVGTDGSFYNLAQLTPSQAAAQAFGNVNWSMGFNNQTSAVGGFFLQGNQVQIFPYGLASDKVIRMTFQRAPADLCLTSAAGRVIAKTGDVVTIDKIQPTWFGTVTYVNVISGLNPHDFVTDATVPTTVYASYAPMQNIQLVNVAGNNLTLPAGTGANVQIGDWVCPAGYSVYAQNIPQELLPALVQKAASMCVHAAGDGEGYKIAQAEYADMMKMALTQISPRVIGKPIKLLPTNSAFRASRTRIWGIR